MIENKSGAPRQECAAEIKPENSTTTFALLPPGGMDCAVCGSPTPVDDIAAVIEKYHRAGSGLGIAVGVCRQCCIKHAPTSAALNAMIAQLRVDDIAVSHPEPTRPQACELSIPRHKPAGFPRRHPAYGARLAAEPPPTGEPLTVTIGWNCAKQLPPPLLVVQPEDNPRRLRFDVAGGRAIRVLHPAESDPDWLLKLAQALIDDGAASVDLIVHPPRSGATGIETLRIYPEPAR